jgi:hypothetical protein
MLNILANHNSDIRKLVDKGYAVSIDSNNLIIRDIPYLDSNKALQQGAIVSKLIFIDENRVKLDDHQIFFCGSHPCELNGSQIRNLGGGPTTLHLTSKDLAVERSFSNKPANGFIDLFEKIESYVTLICGPAMTLHNVNPFTFRTIDENQTSVFKYRDTLTSRAEIGDLSSKFDNEVIAIIGLGGTGSYLLDFLVKTPVKEIRGFDLDPFHIHNAFRSPGNLKRDELGKAKSDVYQKRYEDFRTGINIYSKFIQVDSIADLEGVTFAFVCVDKGSSRSEIFDLLVKMQIPFIDVGMGLQRDKGPISGTLRSTYFSSGSAQEIIAKRIVPMSDPPDDVYRNNIQISELNALNACHAVIKYKQLKGFYVDDNNYYHSLYTIDNSSLLGNNEKD